MGNLFDQIEAYIDGKLVGEALTNFENALKTNKVLREEVDIYLQIKEAIPALEMDRLKRKFSASDAILDAQLEQEQQGGLHVLRTENEAQIAQVARIPFYKTPFFRMAAAVVLVVAAYVVFAPKDTQTTSTPPAFVLEDHEVKYKGWEKKTKMEKSKPLEKHAEKGDINDNNSDEILNKPVNIENLKGTPERKEDAAKEVASKPSSEVYASKDQAEVYGFADDYFGRGEFDKAIEKLQSIEDSNLFRKHSRLGISYYYQEDLANATSNLKKALAQSNEETSKATINAVKWHLAMSFAKQEKLNAAKVYFKELAKGNSEYASEATEVLKGLKLN